jgi:hypothetical protein
MATKNPTHRSPHAIRLLTLLAGLLSTVALTVPAQVPALGVQPSAACAGGGSTCGG